MHPAIFRLIQAVITLLLSATAPVVAQSLKNVYRVTAEADGTGDGSSWSSPLTLQAALGQAKAGDEVWVKGYASPTGSIGTAAGNAQMPCYLAPADGFQLSSGVKLYGGLSGTESTSAEAAAPKSGSKRYALTYQSVLLADTQKDDSIPANYTIFPENPTRADNARHCLVVNLGVNEANLNEANLTTVVSGLVMAGGNASGSADADEGHGGGLLIVNRSSRTDDANAAKRSYEVTQCYFVNNYATRGGAIYVDPSVSNADNYTNRIRHCGIYNNAAGTRSTNLSCGGGVWLGGSAVLCNSEIFNNTGGGIRLSGSAKVVNATIVHNTISAVDLTDTALLGHVPTASGGGTVYNTVMWGSTTLAKTETMPAFRHCAYPEVTPTDEGKDDQGNVWISTANFSTDAAAWFTTPTSNLGYDRSFDFATNAIPSYSFEPMEESALTDAGSSTWYTAYVASTLDAELDILGSRRYYAGNGLDIGAVEREVLSAGRRLYVRPDGNNDNDGRTWETALRDPQVAIDRLYGSGQSGKGEVWVAEGVYVPQAYLKSLTPNDQTTPLAFQMRNGISLYGGFAGTETSKAQRKLAADEMRWQFAHPTILRGADYKDGSARWNSTDESWNVSSKSYHVVWFAPNPYEVTSSADAQFSLATTLEGVTVEGGCASENGDPRFAPVQGSGIYMLGGNTNVRRCTVRHNSAGMKATTTGTPQGGGIYNLGGQVRYCLVYNNSASEGGGIYLSTYGFVNSSMVANNSAANGAGIYVDRNVLPAQYQIVATNIITNNTSTANAALYVKGDGLIEQNTIANNYTSNVTDATGAGNTSYTGGLYATGAVTAINNIICNNSLRQTGIASQKNNSESMAQVYVLKASRDSTLFYHNAISDVNSTAWNGIYQVGTHTLTTTEFKAGSHTQYAHSDSLATQRGVQPTWTVIDYYWPTRPASVLRNLGMLYGQLEKDVMFKPCTDFFERNFESTPPVGPYLCERPDIRPLCTAARPHVLRLHYDADSRTPQGDGSSWANAYNSLDELLNYASTLTLDAFVEVTDEHGLTDEHAIEQGDSIEILVREGNHQPTVPYTFQENDPHSACFNVKASELPVSILGGYPAYESVPSPTDADRNPSKHRTAFTGNASGTALSDGLYHVVRVETGADLTLDGIVIEKGYAAGTAYQTIGGGVLVGSLYAIDTPTRLTLRGCILENNTARLGAALAVENDCSNATIRLVNCVVNNNQGPDQPVISTGNSTNSLTLDYVSVVNNVGLAPTALGTTSYAAGNVVTGTDGQFTPDGAGNTLSLATTDKEGAANFANPTKQPGAALSGNVYYGGSATFRPLTSAEATDVIINRALPSATLSVPTDMAGNERNLGGAPDLGAYEALLPRAGKVVYVRSYNTDWTADDCIDGTPDFNLLNEHPGQPFDGTTWGRAIMGNAICDMQQIDAQGNAIYVTDASGHLLAASLDNPLYGADYNASSAPYGQTSNAYGAFFSSGTSAKKNGNYTNQKRPDGTLYNLIGNNRDERYVSGLQLAVERAAAYNAAHKDDPDYEEMSVWVGAGVYTDFKGFVIRNGVKVYGGFPRQGNPGESDRRPLLSQYVPARKGYESLNKADYETILQVRKESPVYLTVSSREMWYSEGTKDGSRYDFAKKLIDAQTLERHYVLYQPDVCLPTYGISGDGLGTSTGANQYRTADFPKFADPNYVEYKNAKWDGFSVRHGYITNYLSNRDGGAGVRVFRGISIENLIVVNNLTHGNRCRGGGLYMDGDNSTISNSFLLRNLVWGSQDCYGGGAYMIQGTGYNLVVASNRASNKGGGIFIESAKFFNNTVAYNMSNDSQGTGIMHWQDNTTGITSALTLYNCLIYDNMKNNGVTAGTTQVGSTSPGTFNEAHNCYINSQLNSALAPKFSKENGNVTLNISSTMPYPFAVSGNDTRYSSSQKQDVDGGIRFSKARAANDFRLNEADGLDGNPCLNGGTDDMPMVPATDMDYTDRIKDCAIDIGAYEADNTANITPEERTRTSEAADGSTTKETYYVYYVTETGYGNRSGSSPENAACAEKLQSVLTAAGQWADTHDYRCKVYVKVAGYEPDTFGVRFTYHVNTLADPDDPQSYTFLIPQGVWLMGGYNEGTWTTVGTGTSATRRLTGHNWDQDNRDVITSYQTVLSGTTQPKMGSAVGEVTGYHVVSFGQWPKGEITDYALHALPGKTVDGKLVNPSTGIDGVRLVGGAATDNDGFKGMGGGAVVPAYAYVRNCFITDCQAIKGGALALLPGAILSGTVMHSNSARMGGAIYAANGRQLIESYSEYRAYMASCTVCGNSATTGGGICQELGALFGGNSVVWGNTATTDKNISGVVDQQFKDRINHSADPTSTHDEYYPYNCCFVERYQLPGDIGNTSMTSDFETYFATAGEYYPRPYSPLIDNGVTSAYQQLWEKLGVSAFDVKGVTRGVKDRLTAGAYAMTMPDVKQGILITRLFVSDEGGAEVSDQVKADYMGRSFYTPFNSLDAAIAYINHVRTNNVGTATAPRYLASLDTRFEILITGGTYRPSVVRTSGHDVTTSPVADRRMQSFELPVNVCIFGGFVNTDPFSSDPVTTVGTADNASLKQITDINGHVIDLDPYSDMKQILEWRDKHHLADLNKNGLLEPWEFANPTILSGNIKASESERRVYHVVYSRAEADDLKQLKQAESNLVLLDGITVVDGETSDAVAEDDFGDEMVSDVGHGGGIFTWGVNYTLNRCRVLRNKGVHGGGIFVHDAHLRLIGTAVSGNLAQSESTDDVLPSAARGGGICATFSARNSGSVSALNCLMANNSAVGQGRGGSQGGALYVSPLDNTYPYLQLLNCHIVRNEADLGGEVFVDGNVAETTRQPDMPTLLTNTVCWGNRTNHYMHGDNYSTNAHMLLYDWQLSHCATDLRPGNDSDDSQQRASTMGNVLIDRTNMSSTGPRFKSPSTAAGYEGFNAGAMWNPASISVLTDAGEGALEACSDKDYKDRFAAELGNTDTQNAYMRWWQEQSDYVRTTLAYPTEYVDSIKLQGTYRRFVGPLDATTGDPGVRTIDIGLYEFQYQFQFADREFVYIGTTDEGNGSGDSWLNQSSDLRGAIIAMANPTGNKESQSTKRQVFVRGGHYHSPLLTGGDAFSLVVNTGVQAEFVTELEIVGSCEGAAKDDRGREPQDFSQPTILEPNPLLESDVNVANLLNVTTNGRPVSISGFTFRNDHAYTGTDGKPNGLGMTASVNNTDAFTGGSLTLRNCAFTSNLGTGLHVTANDGEVLLCNVLFADGQADGLVTCGRTTVVNATFAQNLGYDFRTSESGTTEAYNSVSWQNGGTERRHSLTDDEARCNTSFAWGTPNDDVLLGPNFTSPATGDYSLRPSLKLFNTADSLLYIRHGLGIADPAEGTFHTQHERDLLNRARVTGGNIDRGAYECTSKLLPIIYVKTGANEGSGESWDKATGSLQNAVNLAELYANTDNGADASKAAYVFVDKGVATTEVQLTLPGVKVYGTMDYETSTAGGDLAPENFRREQVEAVVADLLAQRKGVIEQTEPSRIAHLRIDYTPGSASTASTEPCVVDGFQIDSTATLRRGYLSTSLLSPAATLKGTADGTLYNSLAYGLVSDVRCVNVTAVKDAAITGSGLLPDVTDSQGRTGAANRTEVTEPCRYVEANHWKWQLNDFRTLPDGTADYAQLAADLNAQADSTRTVECALAVCHRRDLAGNLRIRLFPGLPEGDKAYNNVDNGCFETWYVPTVYTASRSDYPHGLSAIYVREEQRSTDDRTMLPFSELRLAPGLFTESNPFTPGFLLLKHHAGLRGNGNYITLRNLAVERELHVHTVTDADGTQRTEGYPDLCVMPFSTLKREQFEQGKLEADGTNDLYRSYAYNGLQRAAYDYQFDAVDGQAWQEAILSTEYATEGMMIVPQKDFTLRFYTLSYNEHGPSSGIYLHPYNFQEPWSTSSTGGIKFTHKENMGWNLFGSPFLCAMNYADLTYSRVIYVNDILKGNGFTALNTADADGLAREGYIPACDAVFTQTATLNNYELMLVTHAAELSGTAYEGARTLSVQLAAEPAAAADSCFAPCDALQLRAVPADEAHADFDLGTDGVKWMDARAPQLYAVNGGARYSLLSAVSREGEVKVGVNVPTAGTYSFRIPADAERDETEVVLLKDHLTGRAVDLLLHPYSFTATAAGEVNGRFTLSFQGQADASEPISFRRLTRRQLRIEGLEPGDVVRLYATDGRLLRQERTSASTCTIDCPTDGIVVAEVQRQGRQVAVRKLR